MSQLLQDKLHHDLHIKCLKGHLILAHSSWNRWTTTEHNSRSIDTKDHISSHCGLDLSQRQTIGQSIAQYQCKAIIWLWLIVINVLANNLLFCRQKRKSLLSVRLNHSLGPHRSGDGRPNAQPLWPQISVHFGRPIVRCVRSDVGTGLGEGHASVSHIFAVDESVSVVFSLLPDCAERWAHAVIDGQRLPSAVPFGTDCRSYAFVLCKSFSD